MMKMNRKNRIEIRLSDVELNCLNKAVEKTGLSREAYLRLIIQKIVPAEKPYPDLKETINQLRRIGNKETGRCRSERNRTAQAKTGGV